MAFDLKATIKLEDAFTGPMQSIIRTFDRVESAMKQNDRMWDNIGRHAEQAAVQIQNFGNETNLSGDHTADLQHQLQEAREEAERLANAGGNAGDNLNDAGTAGQNAGNKISGAFKAAAGIIASLIAVDQIKDLGVGMIEAAADSKAMTAQFSEVFGSMEADAADKLGAIADETTILENRMKGSFTKIAAFAKTGGMDTADSLDLADRSMRVIADSAAFYDKALDDTTESLQSFLKGKFVAPCCRNAA